MKIVHTHHGITGSRDYPLPNVSVSSPRFIGISRPHARYLSSALGIEVRCVHNGIPLPPKTKGEVGKSERNKNKNYNDKDKEYLLSLNRILHEKGIHNAIDIAIETENRIKIVGDDIHGVDSLYVKKIKEKCRNSKGYAEYYGLVDNNTKKEILRNCKAIVGCPEPTWLEAFGLYAVEANAYGKPILALNNGGLNDIVVNGVNGFLGETIEELKKYISNLDQCTPKSCRKRVEEMFTDKIMTTNYLSIFEKVLEDDPGYSW
jgi:glycosyltransferase involved in cell wall biosynthesis